MTTGHDLMDDSTPAPAASLSNRLEQLPLFKKPVVIEPLSGGITNQNFLIQSASGAYVARVCQPRPYLGIDRVNESRCHELAAAIGLTPAISHREHDLLVYPWIEGRALTASDLHNPDTRSRVAGLLARLHDAWDKLHGEILYFCPFQTVRTYARTALRLGATPPAALSATIDDLDRLARSMAPFRPVLCHNDLLPANLIDDSNRLWLIDWEYSGVGQPLFDLANLAANASFTDEEDRELLDAYTSGHATSMELADFRLLKAASYLRESLWSSIQTVTATIDFDYATYAEQNYASYHEARARIDKV